MQKPGRFFLLTIVFLVARKNPFHNNSVQALTLPSIDSASPRLSEKSNELPSSVEKLESESESKLAPLPLIEIVRYNPEYELTPVTYGGKEQNGDKVVLAQVGEQYELKCVSPPTNYSQGQGPGPGDLLQWEVKSWAKNSSSIAYSVSMQRNVGNVFDLSTYTFQLTLDVPTENAEGGGIFTCHYLNNPEIFTRVRVYVGNDSYAESTLGSASFEGQSSTLNPNEGGSSGTEKVFEIWFPAHRPSVSCWQNEGPNDAPIEFKSIRCDNPYDCHISRQCLQTSCPTKELLGIPCNVGTCSVVLQSHFTAMASCRSGGNPVIEHYFLGLNSKRYTIKDSNIPREALIQMDPLKASTFYTDEQASFFCEASSFLFAKGLQFTIKLTNGTTISPPEGTHQLVEINDEPGNVFSHKLNLATVQRGLQINLTEEMTEINCLAPRFNSTTEWFVTSSGPFQVKAPKEPHIMKEAGGETGSPSRTFYIGEVDRTLTCTAEAQPPPTFQWFHNGTEILQSDKRYSIVHSTESGQSVLKFPTISRTIANLGDANEIGSLNSTDAHVAMTMAPSIEGEYQCTVSNRLGNDTVRFLVDVQDGGLQAGVIWGIVLPVLIIFITMLCCTLIYARKYKIAKLLIRDLTTEEITEFFDGDPDKIEKGAGDGRAASDNIHYLPFDKRFEILPDDLVIDKRSILGSGEFGLVLSGQWKGRSVAVKTTKAHCDVSYFKAFLKEVKVMAYIGHHENIVLFIGAVTSRIQERVAYVVVELSPKGSLESYLKANRSTYVNLMQNGQIVKTELIYDNINSSGQTPPMTTHDFVKWSYQIAAGMEYLASKKVIHGDLAVRNILLFENNDAKISDFGLSRQLYECRNYVKNEQEALPWRWLALESLKDLSFSTNSDVWAYGVTVWEIFTMAELPFPGLSWTLEFIEMLECGLRMKKPKFATQEIYKILLDCWEPEPDDRKSFTELKEFFYDILHSVDFVPTSVAIRAREPLYSNYCE